MYAVIPVARSVWQHTAVRNLAPAARRLIILNTSKRDIALSVSRRSLPTLLNSDDDHRLHVMQLDTAFIHHRKKSPTARAYARRVFLFLMFAVRNSVKRRPA